MAAKHPGDPAGGGLQEKSKQKSRSPDKSSAKKPNGTRKSPSKKSQATSRKTSRRQPARQSGEARDVAADRVAADRVADRLRREAAEWRGVPYHLDGTGRRGVDCSGFVRSIYRELFGVELPRTTSKQAKRGKKVARDDLRPGDLVFFKISSRSRHVGAWVGGGKFVHASSSRGVTTSRLSSTYWRQRYWTSRRVL